MFGKEKLRELETRLTEMRRKAEAVEKEKSDLQGQLIEAKAKIQELEKRVADNELETLKAQSRQTIVEFEGLKGLYTDKIREFEDSKAAAEEEFAKEAANKRHDLSEEIRENKGSNQKLVSETISTFAGSYTYYLDQIRVLMDALSRAAKETGETLFNGDARSIRERFGSTIVEHLQNDTGALKQNSGDVLLIGAEELPEESAEAEEEEPAEETPVIPEETAVEIPEETGEITEETVAGMVDEAEGIIEEAAAEIAGNAEKVAEEVINEMAESGEEPEA